MTGLVDKIVEFAIKFGKEGIEAASKQVGRAAGEILQRIRTYVVELILGKGGGAEEVEKFDRRDQATVEKVKELISRELATNSGSHHYISDLALALTAAMGTRQTTDYQFQMGNESSNVGSVFGSGTVTAGGDIVGGSKSGSAKP